MTTAATPETTQQKTTAEREPLLKVEGLKKYFPIKSGLLWDKTVDYVRAVDDVSFEIYPARRSVSSASPAPASRRRATACSSS